MSDAYLVGGVRTAIGRFRGTLSPVRADDLAALPIRELLIRFPEVEPAALEEVALGCANQAGEDNRNVARMASLLAGLPVSVPGITVNRLCASGMGAALDAARQIRLGEGDLFVAGGVEHMTRAPFVTAKPEISFPGRLETHDSSLGWRFINPRMEELYGTESMGCTAENLVAQYSIEREDQDRFALASQQKASLAQASGRLAQEIVAVEIRRRKAEPITFDQDEFIRHDSSLEALARLKPVFRRDGLGSVTAGNSSGLNDGACALLLAGEAGLKRFGLQPRARIVASAAVGVEPRIMGVGPVEASQKALERAGLKLEDMQVIELNEAFAAQCLACLRLLGLADDDPRVNPNGGAIALGHPLGMSGARLLLTAMIELENRELRYALCTLCVGVGQGMATVIERVGS